VNRKTNAKKPPKRPDDPNAQIALKLRAFYHSVQDEALPQKFLDLLEKLDAVESGVQRAD
jgi:Anti-sigma factor NepR